MTDLIFEPSLTTLAVRQSDKRFPVRRVYCVGRNYADHAREMGHDPDREPPFFFTKHPDSLLPSGRDLPYPPATSDLHHEIEMVVALHKGGANISVLAALDHVFGYAVGLDMTRRDLQAAAKKKGHPWCTAKAFDNAAPISDIAPVSLIGHPAAGAITLEVNGQLRQKGDLADMIWNVAETISYLSGLFRLEPGDLIFTGTPAGVAAVDVGDELIGKVEGVGELCTRIGN